EVNADMPDHVVRKVVAGLNLDGKPVRGSRVLILGVAFKRDIDDARNSPAQRVIELLLDAGAQIEYHDPFVPTFRTGGNALHRRPTTLRSVPLDQGLADADAVVILTGHTAVDYARVVDRMRVVVDAVNVTSHLSDASDRVIRLGAPMPASLAGD
ncbi:MAG: UDP-N-acetyl-D-glucosamine dehydrogenase, partial [Anaerolineae bacterium]|nr:UDP-N-acetyl-D-glucosamine dehydrogenase [Anaerolineae bacterium]